MLPRFAAYPIGRLPADEIENWLMDEVAEGIAASSVHRHYRALRRMQWPIGARTTSATSGPRPHGESAIPRRCWPPAGHPLAAPNDLLAGRSREHCPRVVLRAAPPIRRMGGARR